MEEKAGKNVLIVGDSAIEYSLAHKLSLLGEVQEVFVAPGNDAMREFATTVDIREDNIEELLEFALENDIDLTIVSSEKAIKADIASYFQQNGQMIFAPTASSAHVSISKAAGRKFMYKNRMPCPRFAIFDRPNLAMDYAKNCRMPIVIKTDEHQGPSGIMVCPSLSIAQSCIDELFDNCEKRIIIEDFVLGHEFSFYVITDGYHSIPLGTAATYKYALDGNGGLVTSGQGAFVPDYKISRQVEKKILQQIIYPTLNSMARNQTPYVGILGVDCVMTYDDQLFALEFNSFLQAPECQGILDLLDENLYELINACVVGSFADDYDKIDIEDSYAVSCVLSSGKKQGSVIHGLGDLDETTKVGHFNTKKNSSKEYETKGGRTLVITKKAKTLSRAIGNLYDEVSLIKFDGKKYRKDIGKHVRI
jgi:phosphoribosylamine--glycine ligase